MLSSLHTSRQDGPVCLTLPFVSLLPGCLQVFQSLLRLYDERVVGALFSALKHLGELLRDRAPALHRPEHALAVLPLLQTPLLSNRQFGRELIPLLGETVARLPLDTRAALARYISVYPKARLVHALPRRSGLRGILPRRRRCWGPTA